MGLARNLPYFIPKQEGAVAIIGKKLQIQALKTGKKLQPQTLSEVIFHTLLSTYKEKSHSYCT